MAQETDKVSYLPGCWFCASRAARIFASAASPITKLPVVPNIPAFQTTVNEAEASILDGLGLFALRRLQSARDRAELAGNRYVDVHGLANAQGNRADAIRHAYWNALMVRAVGLDKAAELGTAHEMIENFEADEAMDLYNNEQGRNIAVANPSATDAELLQLIIEQADSGNLVVVASSTSLAWSNDPTAGVFLQRPPTPAKEERDEYQGGGYESRRY